MSIYVIIYFRRFCQATYNMYLLLIVINQNYNNNFLHLLLRSNKLKKYRQYNLIQIS